MKIRKKLTLRYTLVTAAVFSAVVFTVLFVSESNREREFYRHLRGEAITKANLFLSGLVNAGDMQAVYLNNRGFIDEVEVAVYDRQFRNIYHDATEIDIVKETPQMLARILDGESVEFYEGKFQAVGLTYPYQGNLYIVTAAAYDGYGIAQQRNLTLLMIGAWAICMVALAMAGYYLAGGALKPVSRIVDEVEQITERNLDKRLQYGNPSDELGELSDTFNRMLDRLERSFDSQRLFVSNVAHELRTPMAALIAELEVTLLSERSGEGYRRSITEGLSDARKIERLLAGLLDMARAQYDPDKVSLRQVRLDEILLDARERVLKGNPQYRVELVFEQDMDDESSLTVTGNEYLLTTAFVNMIENNCKFSDDRTSHIHISYFGTNSILRFSDTGIGIPKEEMDHIFSPFYRGTNAGVATGHGIGMALVRRIISMHGGMVSVHSHVGEGTVFICEIPHI